MDLVLEEKPPRERWPLAFRMAIAVATGAAAAWLASGLVASTADTPVVEASERSGLAWPVAVALLAAATAWTIALRRRILRDIAATVVAAAAGAMLAIASPDRSVPDLPAGPIDVEGTVSTEPRIDTDGGDELAAHSFRQASTSFRLSMGTDGESVSVRVAGMAPLPGRGTPVRVRGWWKPLGTRLNPGIPAREPSAVIEVTSAKLVQPIDDGPVDAWIRNARRTANGWLSESMPTFATDGERALVSAMTTGVRLPGLAPHAADFRAAGMSHVLAISGFNVAVLVAGSVAVAALLGAPASIRALVAVVTAIAFLLVTEPETSVLRAGLGAGLAAAASIRGGRARGLGTLGAVALVAMFIDIRCIRGAGFQLSYGVVVALLAVAPIVTSRWQRRARAAWDAIYARGRVPELPEMAVSATIGSVCASLVAWSVSTPIALHHAGSISWLAAPLSVVTMPAAALATIGGAIAMATHGLLGTAAMCAGSVSVLCVRSLAWIASVAAEHPKSTSATGRPGMAWAAAMAAVIVAGLLSGTICSARTSFDGNEVIVDSMAVSRGSCSLIRTPGTTVILDAGALGDPDAGSRTIVPSLAALGVRRVDALVIGSRSLASCSAVPEVLRAFDVRSVIIERSAAESFAQARNGHGAELRELLRSLGTSPQSTSDGSAIDVGDLRLIALIRSVGERGQQRFALAVRHAAWPPDRRSILVRTDARIPCDEDSVPAAFADDRAIRTVVGEHPRGEVFAWTAEGWRSVGPADAQRGTTIARSSTANAPASDPSAFDSSTSNASAGRSTRSSRRSRSAPSRSRSSSRPPARTTRSGVPAERAVAGRRTTATNREGADGAG
jgi:ComEC/Rec2-related protein